jgi:hypothetical protein
MNDRLKQQGEAPSALICRRRLFATIVVLGAAIGLYTSGPAVAQSTASEKPKSKIVRVAEKDQPIEAFGGYGGGAQIPEPVIPAGLDVFDLSLEETGSILAP